MEEKVYSRSLTKKNLAARVIDRENPERSFTSRELQNILIFDSWVQCDRCQKWRMLPSNVDTSNLPDSWYCEMNTYDKARSSCDAEEQDAKFYHNYFQLQASDTDGDGKHGVEAVKDMKDPASSNTHEQDEKVKSTNRDEILKQLLGENNYDHTSVISKYFFI